ncbi:Cys-tRNA(Pro) deacylase [Brevibacterium litoralis]|uniref:Cys-tRNA(Pro) deacylase n=1 Tax=Brevibacterium litoralis TaxID=3138935 RepID=UPI0032EEFABE
MSVAVRSTQAASTPALRVLTMAGVDYTVHDFEHDPSTRRYGSEAADKLGVDGHRVFKTLFILVDGEPVNALVPVTGQLDLKALAAARGGKKAQLAGIAETERRTGYVTGGVSPFGQRSTTPVVVDRSAEDHDTIYVSAGKRGLEIEIRPGDLVMLANAQVAKIATLD